MIFVIGLAVIIGSIMVTSAGYPMIAIFSPLGGDTVYTDTIAVFGGAMGTEGAIVESVTVNGLFADGTTSWSKDISLQPGQNKITAVAIDNMGQSSSKTIYVSYIASTHSLALTTLPPPSTTIPIGSYRPTPTPTSTPTSTPTPTPMLTPTPMPPATPMSVPMHTGSISITSIPTGAGVYLDDSFAGITPITLEDVTVGYHMAKVSKEGYRSEIMNIYLYKGITKELNIGLEPITGSIAVSSTPSGASVYLDDVDMNKITPCMLSEVLVGQHSIKLTKSDYFNVTRNVSVSVGRTSSLHENLTGYGSIDISSDPPGANVYLDANYTGETPKNMSKVIVGNHTIKLTKSDYDDEIINVSLSVGETLHLHENLTGYGSLRISSYPSGANVYLDGDYKGKTPLDISKVVEGWYSIKLTRQGYKDVAQMSHVSAGMTTRVDETFLVQGAVNISTIADLMLIIIAIIVIIGLLISTGLVVSRRKQDALSKSIMKEGDVTPHVESGQKIDFAKRKDIILLNSPEWIKHKDYAKINPLYEKAQELETCVFG
jgi:hypothetical protein